VTLSANIYVYRSTKTEGLFCFSTGQKPTGLPVSLAPWQRFGVVRPEEKLPHGLQREAIEPGMLKNGYQLFRRKAKPFS
jgi:hypothetical protein